MSACSLHRWALAAVEWQTAQEDLEAEKRDLEEAMQVSLREEEQRKNLEMPLARRSPEELLTHFKGSLVLAAVCPSDQPEPHRLCSKSMWTTTGLGRLTQI